MTKKKYIYKIIEVNQKYRTLKNERFTVKSPDSAVEFIRKQIGNSATEEVLLLGLNTKNHVIFTYRVFKGTVNASIFNPREIFMVALMNNAIRILVAHVHPSSDCTPSREDIEATQRLMEGGEIIGIELIDHIIVTDEEHVSIREYMSNGRI